MVKCNRDQVERLKKALQREKDPVVHQRIQMVLLREDGMTQPKIGELTGVSLSSVNRAHMAYDNGGVNALRPKPTGGRRRENMTLEEEEAFLARFAQAAGAGELLNICELKAAYEKEIGHPTSNSTIYNLLTRHKWRKLMPRPFHPERNVKAQRAYKEMEEQKLIVTEGNSPSRITHETQVLRTIRSELLGDAVEAFVASVRNIDVPMDELLEMVKLKCIEAQQKKKAAEVRGETHD